MQQRFDMASLLFYCFFTLKMGLKLQKSNTLNYF